MQGQDAAAAATGDGAKGASRFAALVRRVNPNLEVPDQKPPRPLSPGSDAGNASANERERDEGGERGGGGEVIATALLRAMRAIHGNEWGSGRKRGKKEPKPPPLSVSFKSFGDLDRGKVSTAEIIAASRGARGSALAPLDLAEWTPEDIPEDAPGADLAWMDVLPTREIEGDAVRAMADAQIRARMEAAGSGQNTHLILHSGESVADCVPEEGLMLYRFDPPEKSNRLLIRLKALAGDPDLYASFVHERPSKDSHQFASANDGDDDMEVTDSSPEFRFRPLYIGVYGATRAVFRLTVLSASSADLSFGCEEAGRCWRGNPSFYRIRVEDDAKSVVIRLLQEERDAADPSRRVRLYVSHENRWPTRGKCEWTLESGAAGAGAAGSSGGGVRAELVVDPVHPAFKTGTWFIAAESPRKGAFSILAYQRAYPQDARSAFVRALAGGAVTPDTAADAVSRMRAAARRAGTRPPLQRSASSLSSFSSVVTAAVAAAASASAAAAPDDSDSVSLQQAARAGGGAARPPLSRSASSVRLAPLPGAVMARLGPRLGPKAPLSPPAAVGPAGSSPASAGISPSPGSPAALSPPMPPPRAPRSFTGEPELSSTPPERDSLPPPARTSASTPLRRSSTFSGGSPGSGVSRGGSPVSRGPSPAPARVSLAALAQQQLEAMASAAAASLEAATTPAEGGGSPGALRPASRAGGARSPLLNRSPSGSGLLGAALAAAASGGGGVPTRHSLNPRALPSAEPPLEVPEPAKPVSRSATFNRRRSTAEGAPWTRPRPRRRRAAQAAAAAASAAAAAAARPPARPACRAWGA
eukprot:tig00021105_g18267.t1